MARMNLVVLCAAALLAVATQADARRYPRQSSSVSVTVVGPGSYSYSGTKAFSSTGVGSPSKFVSRLFDEEKDTILREERQAKSSTSTIFGRSASSTSTASIFVPHKSADNLVRSKLPRREFPAPPRFTWPVSSKPTFSRNRSFSRAGAKTRTTSRSRISATGNSQVSVGGSSSAHASSKLSFKNYG